MKNKREKENLEEELKEIRGYNKEDMLYPDRCMLKWQGMMLSDHSEALFDAEETLPKSALYPQD